MPDISLAIRLKDRLTARCQKLKMLASGPCGGHRYDVIQVLPGLHMYTGQERLEYAILIVTDVPDKDVAVVRERLTEGTEVRIDPCSKEELSTYTDRPRIVQIPPDLLKAAATKVDAKTIDDVYDVKKLPPGPPSIPWSELKEALWNKVTEAKPVLTATVVARG